MDNGVNGKIDEIVMRLKDGDQKAFETLYELTHDRVYFLALKVLKNRDDALEVMQETYMSIYQNIGKLYRPEAFHAWLSKIVINKCRDRLGKPKDVLQNDKPDSEHGDLSDAVEDVSGEFIPHEVLDQSETRNMIMALIDSLPDAQRTTVMLYYYQELRVEEIAAIMECPVATVKSRLNYARRQIKTGVEGYEAQGVKLYNVAAAPLLLYLLAETSKQSALSPLTASNLFSAIARLLHIASSAAQSTAGASGVAAHGASAGAHKAATGAAKFKLLARLAASSVKAKIIAGIAAAVLVTVAVATPVVLSTSTGGRSPGPRVATFYTLNKTFTASDGKEGTFDIALPKVDSKKPGASAYNDVFIQKSEAYDKMTPDDYYPGGYFPGLERIGYKPFAYGNVLTLALSDTNSGEFRTSVSLYYYDYASDKVLAKADMVQRLGLNEDVLLQKLKYYASHVVGQPADLVGQSNIGGVFQENGGKFVVVLNYVEDAYQEYYIYNKNKDTISVSDLTFDTVKDIFTKTDILESGFIFSTGKPAVAATESPTPAPPSLTPAATAQAPAPAASEWENKYKPVLDKYREFAAQFNQNGNTDFSNWGHPWDDISPDVTYSTKKFGYAFRDMDNNGTPELFLLTSDNFIWAVYTFVDGAPKMLDSFVARDYAHLDQSDVIYNGWSDGAADNGYDLYRISADGRKLDLSERIGMESMDGNGNQLKQERYYKCVGSLDNKTIITEAEYDAETSKFPENNGNSGLSFIPLN